MGLQCELKRVFSFIYHTPVENNLIEHEYDHVLVGYTDREPVPNVNEVMNYKWIDRLDLLQQIAAEPDAFTYWFRIALPQIIKHI
jgi:isopentenyl-diphosphate delta-isomerase